MSNIQDLGAEREERMGYGLKDRISGGNSQN